MDEDFDGWPASSTGFRYRQSDEGTPWEDYFTEILADVLEKHEALGAAFVGYLTSCNDIQRIDIQTQKRLGDAQRRPDVYVAARDSTSGRHVLIVENKIDALEGENRREWRRGRRSRHGEQGAFERNPRPEEGLVCSA